MHEIYEKDLDLNLLRVFLVVAEAGSRRILGAAALCDAGSEVVQLFVELMNAGATADTMLDAVHIHPTLGEAAKNAVAAIFSWYVVANATGSRLLAATYWKLFWTV